MNCLLCYKPLTENEIDYHAKCIKKTFGLTQMPLIDIDEKKLSVYAKRIVGGNTAITGVQPKLSLWLEESRNNIRFTIVDDKSNYIIKPQSETYNSLPENEDLCMHIAEALGVKTAVHGLIRLPSGSLAYITKRFDRIRNKKLACEDLCQLTETLTEHKYRSSYEKVGKVVNQYSTQSGLDTLHYFELVLVSFLMGNSDMHLKNFSMLEGKNFTFALSPAYDLVSTALTIKNEPEQMCLTINGKKNKIVRNDFDQLARSLSLTKKQIENTYQSVSGSLDDAYWWLENSFLASEQRKHLKEVVSSRARLFSE